jgi:hypothetical protein
MKNKFTVFVIALFCSSLCKAQNKWFTVYDDSAALVKTAEVITEKFTADFKAIKPGLKLSVSVVKNTTPYLIFIYHDTINLHLWSEVVPQQKDFFTEVSGGEKAGKEVFGLFFNGFYVVHEIGHAVTDLLGKKYDNAYASEYDANILSMLYWKKVGEADKLLRCYQYAKIMLGTLKNPVPAGEDHGAYITKHYAELSSDPYKYGYIQFRQFVEIFEATDLPDFDVFIKNELKMK